MYYNLKAIKTVSDKECIGLRRTYQIQYRKERTMWVSYRSKKVKFEECGDGLYYHNLKQHGSTSKIKTCFLNTVSQSRKSH